MMCVLVKGQTDNELANTKTKHRIVGEVGLFGEFPEFVGSRAI